MKLVFATNYFFPGLNAGGPIKSLSLLIRSLKKKFKITVLTSDRDFGNVTPYENIVLNKIISCDGYDAVYLTKINGKSINHFMIQINPDIIYLNSFFSNFTIQILKLKRKGLIKSKIILAPRGELSQGALSIKSTKKLVYLKVTTLLGWYQDVVFHATDISEEKDIRIFFKNRIYNIPNLISVIDKSIGPEKKVPGKLKIIFLSRITPKKNLLYALEILKQYQYPGNLLFDIYGNLEDKKYWLNCKRIISLLSDNIKVSYQGVVLPENLPEILSRYQLLFLPTKNENFGHVIVEAMQCGLLPLISDQTPWNDLHKMKAGWSLDLKKPKLFRDAIYEALAYSQKNFLDKSKNAKKYITSKLNNSGNIDKYINMFELTK